MYVQLHIQAKEHLEMMQRQQMEQRMRKLKKANKSKVNKICYSFEAACMECVLIRHIMETKCNIYNHE